MSRTLKMGIFASLLTVSLAACEFALQGTETPTSGPDQPVAATPLSPTPMGQPTSTSTPTSTSAPGSDEVARGEVYIVGSELEIAESYPVQVYLHVWGNTPTPCHKLKYEISDPDVFNRIEVTLWTEADPGLICIQVLASFDERIPIPMEGRADGTYDVWLNGEYVGEFDYPA